MDKTIRLGSEVKDVVTGFSGIVLGIAHYLYGCTQVLVKPKKLHDGKTLDGEWIDIQRFHFVSSGLSESSSEPSGGPQSEAPTVR